MVVHNETATGVTSDVAAIRRAMDACDHPAMLLVDGVSSIGSIDFRMDEWGVDLAVTGSQKGLLRGFFPYTPALSLLFGLRESLDLIEEEGLDEVIARHHRLAEGVRAAVAAWGLATCARRPEWCSDTITAVMTPPGVDGAEVIDTAFRRYNLALGAGLARAAGRPFRIGHMGDLNELMVLGALAGSELAMFDCGVDVTRAPPAGGRRAPVS